MTRIRSKGWSVLGGRKCSICGQPYNRRNLTEVWDQRNPGKRLGWNKTVVKLCMRCFSIEQALRVTAVIAVSPGATKAAEKRLAMLRNQLEEIKRYKTPLPEPKKALPPVDDGYIPPKDPTSI